jgi:hypothetical protein
MAYEFMRERKGEYSIREMDMNFRGVNRRVLQRGEAGPSQRRGGEDAALPGLIREIVTKHRWRYGSPQMREEPRRAFANRAAREGLVFHSGQGRRETLDGRHTAAVVRQSVFMYIKAYYNRLRLHSALDYVAPDVFNVRPGRVMAPA